MTWRGFPLSAFVGFAIAAALLAAFAVVCTIVARNAKPAPAPAPVKVTPPPLYQDINFNDWSERWRK